MPMNYLLKLLKSRTVLTFLALFLFHGLQGTQDLIPVAYVPFVDAVLTLLGIYFRVNTVQKL